MEKVGPADRTQGLVGYGKIAFDAHVAKDMAAGGDGPALLDAVRGLDADIDLADCTGRVDVVEIKMIIIMAGDRSLDGRLQLHGLHDAPAERTEGGRAAGEIVKEVGGGCE